MTSTGKTLLMAVLCFGISNAYPQGVPKPERVRMYDVHHIKMDVSFDWDKKMVMGETQTSIVPLEDGMMEFEVDAIAFDIEYVKEGGSTLNYDYDGKKIIVKPGRELSKSDTFVYNVKYTCIPQRGIYFVYPSELNPSLPYQIWSQGQGEDNKYWLPIYDYPNDKATTEMYVTVDNKFTTLSNGYLESETPEGSRIRYHWVQDKPHPSYLIMVGVGEWDIVRDYAGGVEIMSYISRDRSEEGRYAVRNTGAMMKMFEDKFGYKYPWANYKQVIVEDFIYGGMENTTATVLNARTYYRPEIEDDYGADGLISHELGHQWWGDLTTCRNWSEIWLNESFATYSSAMWKEEYLGKDEYDYYLLRNSDEAMRVDTAIKRLPIWAGYGDITENVYDKGSVILNTFRHLLGDKLFYETFSAFLKDNEFGSVETQDMIDAVNKVMNRETVKRNKPDESYIPWDSKGMFEQWIWKAGYPEFDVSYLYNEDKEEVYLKIKQVQKIDTLTPLFKLPVDIRIYGEGKDTTFPVFISGRDMSSKVSFNAKPDFVQFDYGNKILDKTVFVNSPNDYIEQFKNSKDAIDRIMAIRGMQRSLSYGREGKGLNIRPPSKLVFIDDIGGLNLNKSLLKDEFWGVRKEAVDFYSFLANNPHFEYYVFTDANQKTSKPGKELIYDFIKEKYDSESHSRVKRAILTALGNSREEKNVEFIRNKIENETNEYIVAEGVVSLGKMVEPERVYDLVMPYINRSSHREIIKTRVVEALDSANNRVKDERIKQALLDVAFGIDVESRLRAKAVKGLFAYAGDEDVKALAKKYIDYNFRSVKYALVGLLGESGDTSIIPFLKELNKRTTDSGVKKKIEMALKKLEG